MNAKVPAKTQIPLNKPEINKTPPIQTQPQRAPAEQSEQIVSEEPASDGKSIIRTKKIQHPGAKDGLYLIDEEGNYHYKVETLSKKDHSMFFRFISQSPPNITTDVNGETFGFADFYGGGQTMGLEFIYEWQPWSKFGKAGFQLGAGLMMANGKGFFANGSTREPKENFTLFSFPLTGGVIYRFEFTNRQWVVPYAAGGLLYNPLIEYRDDGKTKAVGAPGAYGGGGLMVNLTALNKKLAFIMDREYGFSNLWFTAEYRVTQSFNEDLDISSDQISVGLGADY